MPQILTANRLGPGEVVYWNGTGWAVDFGAAAVLEKDRAETALKAAQDWVRRREVVNPYLFEVRVDDGRAAPVKVREAIRATGPTVRRDLGKQAVLHVPV